MSEQNSLVKLRANAVLEYLHNSKYTVCVPTAEGETADGSETACAILAEVIDTFTDDGQVVVYLTGEFNSSALGNTVAGDKRSLNIQLTINIFDIIFVVIYCAFYNVGSNGNSNNNKEFCKSYV